MTTDQGTFDDNREDAGIPADLLALDARFRALGEHDRLAGDDELEHRLAGATLGSLFQIGEVEADVHRLGAVEQNAAATTLEDRVFESSRSLLGAHISPVVAHIGGARRTAGGRVWARRLALAACLGLVGTGAVWLMRGGRGTPVGEGSITSGSVGMMSIADLKATLDRDVALLLTAVSETGAEQTQTGEYEFDAEWIDDLVEGGKAS